jgi:hypothetical protein
LTWRESPFIDKAFAGHFDLHFETPGIPGRYCGVRETLKVFAGQAQQRAVRF